MAIIKKQPRIGKIVIDITGREGNAYSLMANAINFCKQLGIDSEPILKEMKSGDYENLLLVFDKHFGDFCDLAR